MARPRVRYARSGDTHIAFSVAGGGGQDLTIVLPTLGTIEMLHEPPARAMSERFQRFSRSISFDRRGTGISDPSPPATLEEQMADVDAVLDAARSVRTILYSEAEGAMMALMYAATHPDRVSHLVLLHGMARVTSAPGYEWPWSEEERTKNFVEPLTGRWGTGELGESLAPVLHSRDASFGEWWGRWERLSASPGVLAPVLELTGRMDVREILPQVQVPTLVLNRPDAAAIDDRHAEYLAANIPNAELRTLPGRDAVSFGDGMEEFCDAIEDFCSGVRQRREAERVLSTVMFTDIVASTERAAELGDTGWRSVLERHDELSRRLVRSHGGRPVKSTGDGFLATFDGPARGVQCARELCTEVRELGIELRAGLHTGEVELIGDDVGGMAVHIGARVGARAGSGEVLVSSTVKDLVVGSAIGFADKGGHELKGVPGEWRLFAVQAEEQPAEV